MNDYARVAAVIRHLNASYAQQPGLDELSAALRLSPSHFHRLFHRWAGVTPKDFLQCLTVEHAKRLLRMSAPVFEAALDAGLSGPGRLHDLMVTLEAASPGEYKSGGKGMTIGWGWAESPFGVCSLGWTKRGICHLAFQDERIVTSAPEELRQNWPKAILRRADNEARRLARVIFRRSTEKPTVLRAYVRGSPFEVKVWRALVRIPQGAVTSYGALARAIGEPHAARAAGKACGSNSVAFLIPCHRVIRETGVVTGYRWGAERKKAMLAWESGRTIRSDLVRHPESNGQVKVVNA